MVAPVEVLVACSHDGTAILAIIITGSVFTITLVAVQAAVLTRTVQAVVLIRMVRAVAPAAAR